jgi:hypothetical protein
MSLVRFVEPLFVAASLGVLAQGPVAWGAAPSDVRSLGALLRSDDPATARRAERRLVKLKSEEAYDELVTFALEHLVAGKWFGSGGDLLARVGPRVIPAMVRAYPRQSDEVKWSMLDLAPDWGPVSAPLIELALTEPNSRRLGLAAWAVGRARLPHARERLTAFLKNPDLLVREGAISGLRVLHDPAAIDALLEVLESPNAEIPREQPVYLAPTDLHGLALQAINEITGQHFEGDVDEIREWWKKQTGRRGAAYR